MLIPPRCTFEDFAHCTTRYNRYSIRNHFFEAYCVVFPSFELHRMSELDMQPWMAGQQAENRYGGGCSRQQGKLCT